MKAKTPNAKKSEAKAPDASKQQPQQQLVTAADFPWKGEVVEIDSKTTISDALEVLTSKHLLSAPVYDAQAKKYLGFFDLADVLALVYGVDLLRHMMPVSKLREQTVDVHGIKLNLAYSRDAQGTDLPVSMMMQVDGKIAPWWPVEPSAPLISVVKRLAARTDPPWSSCRRVPVLDPATGKVTKIISQSSLVKQVYKSVVEHQAAEPLFIQTPRTHQHGICAVACVRHDELARVAFEHIINERISAVPVLGPEGGMVSAITNKDIFLLQKMRQNFGGKADEVPALEFVERARKLARELNVARSEPVTVSLDTPIHVIVQTLALKETHRVFVLAGDNEPPAGIVSVSDIVKLILDEGLPWPQSVILDKLAHSKP